MRIICPAPVWSGGSFIDAIETAMSEEQESSEISIAGEGEPITPHLGNIAFWVSNFDAMRGFYSEILGVPEIAAGADRSKWVFYAYGPFSFSLNEADYTVEPKGWNRCPVSPTLGDNWEPYITFYVPDLQAVIERCKAAGIVLRTEEPFSLGEGFGLSIDVMDPDGNAVAITERPS